MATGQVFRWQVWQRNLASDESGATSIDYAMVVCAVALAVVTMVGAGASPGGVMDRAAELASALVGGNSTAIAQPSDTDTAAK